MTRMPLHATTRARPSIDLANLPPSMQNVMPRVRCAPRCVDLDGDGVIRPREMLHFYEEQLKRLEGWNQEPVQFEDLLCQLHDMLNPAVEGAYTLRWGKMHGSWTWRPIIPVCLAGPK